jgi:hypothetical protein
LSSDPASIQIIPIRVRLAEQGPGAVRPHAGEQSPGPGGLSSMVDGAPDPGGPACGSYRIRHHHRRWPRDQRSHRAEAAQLRRSGRWEMPWQSRLTRGRDCRPGWLMLNHWWPQHKTGATGRGAAESHRMMADLIERPGADGVHQRNSILSQPSNDLRSSDRPLRFPIRM